MPSDPRLTSALELLTPAIERYHTAVAATLEEVRGHLAAGRSDASARAERLRDQLGVFAAGRIDTSRLATVLGTRDALDASSLKRLEQASYTLRNIVSRGHDLFVVAVPAGGDMALSVSNALASIGRAFAAARIASAARSRAASGLDEARALNAFPFGEWNAAERRLAPPLVVSVSGGDLAAASLAPFLDGAQKFVLIVDGPAAPAPLVRLITPGVLVIQAHGASELAPLTTWPATAVAALMPATALRFTHDPGAGATPWQRLTVIGTTDARLARVGGATSAQQTEEVRQLDALAAPPPAVTVAAPVTAVQAASDVDPVDRLAAWLLQQAQVQPSVTGH